jgi:hypothetical protein
MTNCQIGGFAAYVSSEGHAFVDRRLYLPKAWTGDPERLATSRWMSHKPSFAGQQRTYKVPSIDRLAALWPSFRPRNLLVLVKFDLGVVYLTPSALPSGSSSMVLNCRRGQRKRRCRLEMTVLWAILDVAGQDAPAMGEALTDGVPACLMGSLGGGQRAGRDVS